MSVPAALVALAVLTAALLSGPDRSAHARLHGLRGGPSSTPPGTSPDPAGNRRPAADDPALVLDLVAAALATGVPEATALAVVGDAVGGADGDALRLVAHRMRLGAGVQAAWDGTSPRHAALRRCLQLSAATGAPAATLMRASAQELRRARRRRAEVAAQRLGVRVVLPLGLCALPGFAAWGVVPVVLGLAADVLGR